MNYKLIIGCILVSCISLLQGAASSSSSSSSSSDSRSHTSPPTTTLLPMIKSLPISLMHLIYRYSGIPQELRHTIPPQWDPAPEQAAYSYPYQYLCSYSPDHSHVATLKGSTITPGTFTSLVLEVATNNVVFSKESNFVPSITGNMFFWSCNGDLLACWYPGNVVIIVAPFSGKTDTIATIKHVTSFSWSATDNNRFATLNTFRSKSAGPEINIHHIDADNGHVIVTKNFPLIFTPDAKYSLLSADLLWHPQSEAITILTRFDGNSLQDNSNYWLASYDISSGKQRYAPVKLNKNYRFFNTGALSPSGNSIAIPHTEGIFIYDTLHGTQINHFNIDGGTYIRDVIWVNDMTLCVSCSEDAAIYKVLLVAAENGRVIKPIARAETKGTLTLCYCSDLNQLLIQQERLVTATPTAHSGYWVPEKTTAYQQRYTEGDIRRLCGAMETPKQPTSQTSSSSSSSSCASVSLSSVPTNTYIKG